MDERMMLDEIDRAVRSVSTQTIEHRKYQLDILKRAWQVIWRCCGVDLALRMSLEVEGKLK